MPFSAIHLCKQFIIQLIYLFFPIANNHPIQHLPSRLLRTPGKKTFINFLLAIPSERLLLSNTMPDYLTPLSLTWLALGWRAIAHTFNSDSMQGFDGTSTKSFSFGRINHKRSHLRGRRPNRLFRTTDSKRMRWNCEELEMNSLSNCALTQVHTNVL